MVCHTDGYGGLGDSGRDAGCHVLPFVGARDPWHGFQPVAQRRSGGQRIDARLPAQGIPRQLQVMFLGPSSLPSTRVPPTRVRSHDHPSAALSPLPRTDIVRLGRLRHNAIAAGVPTGRGRTFCWTMPRRASPEVASIVDMALSSGSETRRACYMSVPPRSSTNSKRPCTAPSNHALLASLPPEQVEVDRAMPGSVVGWLQNSTNVVLCHQSDQRWLWHAIDHHTGQVLAYVFGRGSASSPPEGPVGTVRHHPVLHGRLGDL